MDSTKAAANGKEKELVGWNSESARSGTTKKINEW